VNFGTLTVIVLAGLGGPLLSLSGRRFVPVVIGEIVAGMLVGRTGLGVVNPANATISALGAVGFAMLMLTVGFTYRCAIRGSPHRFAAAWRQR
jgi:Kef-type K+ transport system membrane component KefB